MGLQRGEVPGRFRARFNFREEFVLWIESRYMISAAVAVPAEGEIIELCGGFFRAAPVHRSHEVQIERQAHVDSVPDGPLEKLRVRVGTFPQGARLPELLDPPAHVRLPPENAARHARGESALVDRDLVTLRLLKGASNTVFGKHCRDLLKRRFVRPLRGSRRR